MSQITEEIGLSAANLPSPSTLCKVFDRMSMSVCRVLLRQSAQLHDPSKQGAIDATFYERSAASRHYCQRSSYRVYKLKVTKLVDTASQAVLDIHCSTNREGSDADLAEQIARRNSGDLRPLAADKGYDKKALRENRRTALQSTLNDRNCELGCEALARLRRANAFLVPRVPKDRPDVCRLQYQTVRKTVKFKRRMAIQQSRFSRSQKNWSNRSSKTLPKQQVSHQEFILRGRTQINATIVA